MLLRRPPDHRPAGDSSPTTSSTARARLPSSTAPDEDPLSISSSRRISRPILHLQGAASTFASSIAPPPSPQRRLDLPHQNLITLTNSSNEAEANSAPPRRFCTHRCILSFFDLTGLPVLDTEQTWRVSIDGAVAGNFIHGVSPPCRCFIGGDFHNGTSCSCSGSCLRCGSVLAVGRAAALLLLSFMLLLCSCSRLCCCCCCTTSGSYRSCCFSTRSQCYCMTCSLLVRSLLERLLI